MGITLTKGDVDVELSGQPQQLWVSPRYLTDNRQSNFFQRLNDPAQRRRSEVFVRKPVALGKGGKLFEFNHSARTGVVQSQRTECRFANSNRSLSITQVGVWRHHSLHLSDVLNSAHVISRRVGGCALLGTFPLFVGFALCIFLKRGESFGRVQVYDSSFAFRSHRAKAMRKLIVFSVVHYAAKLLKDKELVRGAENVRLSRRQMRASPENVTLH